MGHWRRQGKTVVFVTNRLEFVGQSDSVLVIDRGSIVAHGTPDEVGTLYHRLSMSACFSSYTRRSWYPPPLPFHVCMCVSHLTPDEVCTLHHSLSMSACFLSHIDDHHRFTYRFQISISLVVFVAYDAFVALTRSHIVLPCTLCTVPPTADCQQPRVS